MHETNNISGGSVLASLRALMPARKLSLREAVGLAERQAQRLLDLRGAHDAPINTMIVTALPRILLEADPDIPRTTVSGASNWDDHRKTWVISINPYEPPTRQRMTILHEYKHIIDHGHPGLRGRLPRTVYGLAPAEFIAEYFAGCVLVPKRTLKRAWYQGIQHLDDLARLFDVSTRAIQVRLGQVGLAPDPRLPTVQLPDPRPHQFSTRFYSCDRTHWRGLTHEVEVFA